jgi:hypothetical protein
VNKKKKAKTARSHAAHPARPKTKHSPAKRGGETYTPGETGRPDEDIPGGPAPESGDRQTDELNELEQIKPDLDDR